GQAAPLRLRLYELKKDTAFGRADYFALTDNAQSTLGGDLVEQDEFLLRPGEERRIERTLDEQTRQLGFVAAYRDLDRATWRQVLAVPGQRTSHLDITLGAQAIGIVARPAP
ncbi:type VI secretion system lipoprotein TssJ, partial [Pseudomonas aeruginosa]